ncbi:MAG: ATP-NAD kinase family protein [Pseudomonadota bacterium]
MGLVLNPYAGIGGPAALKGSDGEQTVARALALGSTSHVHDRVRTCLGQVEGIEDTMIYTAGGEMGERVCAMLGLPHQVVYQPASAHTSAEDTRAAVREIMVRGVDLLVFAGGDGTARDVVDVLPDDQPALGIPCGVKMHSGVFANNPGAAARVLSAMIAGQLVTVMRGEVRDIDEDSFRAGIVKTRYHGEMWVPEELRYLQQVKSGGREIEALAVQEIAAEVIQQMDPGTTYLLGSGSTTAAVSEALGLPGTLLGVDVVQGRELVLLDATESQLYDLVASRPCRIVVTAIGGQGHIFGRGNQQFSPRVIRAVGIANILIVATKSKLEALGGKPMLVDTGDPALDHELCGTRRVITGFEDAVLYPVTD